MKRHNRQVKDSVSKQNIQRKATVAAKAKKKSRRKGEVLSSGKESKKDAPKVKDRGDDGDYEPSPEEMEVGDETVSSRSKGAEIQTRDSTTKRRQGGGAKVTNTNKKPKKTHLLLLDTSQSVNEDSVGPYIFEEVPEARADDFKGDKWVAGQDVVEIAENCTNKKYRHLKGEKRRFYVRCVLKLNNGE